jgi:ABC-type antimicrobial peptide transport system permease subunit
VLRTRELGIRLALGASRQGVLGRGLTLVGLSIAAGLGGALAFTRVLRALLYDVSATDPSVFAAIIALLTSVGVAACYRRRSGPRASIRWPRSARSREDAVLRDLRYAFRSLRHNPVLFLAAVALVASWLPARRAVRSDPVEALRSE